MSAMLGKRLALIRCSPAVTVSNPDDVQTLIEKGQANRRVGKTDFNEHSSRSHTIFTVVRVQRVVT